MVSKVNNNFKKNKPSGGQIPSLLRAGRFSFVKIENRFKELYLNFRRPTIGAVKRQLVREGYNFKTIEQVVRKLLRSIPSQVRIIAPNEH